MSMRKSPGLRQWRRGGYRRRLLLEPVEDRVLLTTYTVNSTGDTVGTLVPVPTNPITGISLPLATASGSFNTSTDNFADLATIINNPSSPTGKTLQTYFSTGNGTFQAPRTLDLQPLTSGSPPFNFNPSLPTLPIALAAGDFNGDGKTDLAVSQVDLVSSRLQGFVDLLVGNGDGTFTQSLSAAQTIDFPLSTLSFSVISLGMTAADFVGGPATDLVLGISKSVPPTSNYFLLEGSGTGTFTVSPLTFPSSSPVTSGSISGLAPGHFASGPGQKSDLAVANAGGTIVLNNNQNGTFTDSGQGVSGSFPGVGDFNADGHDDLVTANTFFDSANSSTGTTIGIWFNNGNNTFPTSPSSTFTQSSPSFGSNVTPTGVVTGDFTGVGSPGVGISLSTSLSPPTGPGQIAVLNPELTLRQAIQLANLNPGPDQIHFNIPPNPHTPTVQTITPQSALPTITDPVLIDGYTQPGALPNSQPIGDNAALRIQLSGPPPSSIGGTTSFDGLTISSATAGGTVVQGLVINGFFNGINVLGGGSGIEIRGNFIGTDPTGTLGPGNMNHGVQVSLSPTNVVIGGTSPSDRNLISGNSTAGVLVSKTTNVLVAGNLIGTDRTGTKAIGNRYGVFVSQLSSEVTVGGPTVGARNVISGNASSNVLISDATATNNVVAGNFIGTDLNGNAALGNGADGVFITFGASNNTVGGATAAEGNTIAFNNRGVLVDSGTGNAILSNSIFSNSGLGIDLGGDGVTPNNSSAASNGFRPNNLQNFPVLSGVTSYATSTTTFTTLIEGTLTSTPNADFRIQFFASPAADPSGFGEGQQYLGETFVTTDQAGSASFTATFSVAVSLDWVVTATATANATGDTSEFSRAVGVVSPFVVTTTADRGIGSLRQAIDAVNAKPPTPNADGTPDQITFKIPDIPGSRVRYIVPSTPLPEILNPVDINGYSQPGGASPNSQQIDESGYNAQVLVALDGTRLRENRQEGYGLFLAGGNSSVEGLALLNFDIAGIVLAPNIRNGKVVGDNNRITGNYIGVDPPGGQARINVGNGLAGIYIVDSSYNTIGGPKPADRNLISSNGTREPVPPEPRAPRGAGVLVSGNVNVEVPSSPTPINIDATNNRIEGNWIGPGPDGNQLRYRGDAGVFIDNASSNTIVRNLISGNGGVGIQVVGPKGGTSIQGNRIGTDPTGTGELGNGAYGISIIDSSNNTIGGGTTTDANSNLISGNGASGITIEQSRIAIQRTRATSKIVPFEPPRATGNLVQGNRIGTDVNGQRPLGNRGFGVQIVEASGNTIAGNTIAFNRLGAIQVRVNGQPLIGAGTGGNVISNNRGEAGQLVTNTLPRGPRRRIQAKRGQALAGARPRPGVGHLPRPRRTLAQLRRAVSQPRPAPQSKLHEPLRASGS